MYDSDDNTKFIPTLTLTRHTGLLLAFQQQDYKLRGDPDDLKKHLITITIKNLLFGWWSPKSLIINPFVILSNIEKFFKYKRELEKYQNNPNLFIENSKQAHKDSVAREERREKKAVKTLIVLIGIFIVLLAYAFTVNPT